MKTFQCVGVCLVLVNAAACMGGGIGMGDMGANNNTNTAVTDANSSVGSTSSGNANNANSSSSCAANAQQPNGFVGGASMCCAGTFKLCDDFETEAVGGSPNVTWWGQEKLTQGYGLTANQTVPAGAEDTNAIIEITDKYAARGSHALHIYAPNDGWHHDMVVNRTIFPAPNNSFWGRAFIYFNSTVPGGHSTYMDASGNIPGNNGVTYVRMSTFPHLAINYWGGDQTHNSNNISLPTNTWACMEWAYDGQNKEVHLFLNGEDIADVPATDTAIVQPEYDTFRIGWETYSYQYNPTPPNFDMYYDEIALDYARIGCDK